MTEQEVTATIQIEVGRYSVKRADAGGRGTEVTYPLRVDVFTDTSPPKQPLLTVLCTALDYEGNSSDRKRAPSAEELTVALKQAITTIPNLWTWYGSALRAIVSKIDEATVKVASSSSEPTNSGSNEAGPLGPAVPEHVPEQRRA